MTWPTDHGYSSRAYADALAEFGRATPLAGSGTWCLTRAIPGSDRHDVTSCYPLLTCQDWTGLAGDINALDRAVTFAAVLDPMIDHNEAALRDLFPDAVVATKPHHVTDLSRPLVEAVTKHHQRYARKAMRELQIERLDDPTAALGDWLAVYGQLIEHHRITGIRAFSPQSFARQLTVPGLHAFRAALDGEVMAMLLWLVQGDVAYYHLGASTNAGYGHKASFGLFWRALQHFQEMGLSFANLGGGAGASGGGGNLDDFKRGWATDQRQAWFCGRILDHVAYAEACAMRGSPETAYFPAYRLGEFA